MRNLRKMWSRSGWMVAAILGASAAVWAAEPPVDRAARTEEVRKTELAFASAVMDRKPEVFKAMLDPDAVFVGGDGVTRGRDAIAAAWMSFFADGAPYFEWHPEVVELSGDGDLGLSRGPWTIRTKDKDGNPKEIRGTYNSIWRRQADGSWKIVFDAGCSPCPPCGG
ncbi:MAG: nuclear transport factor 2 family protein [Thermoanaerobaculia bacterium]